MSFALLAPQLGTWAKLGLVSGSFCVGYLRRFRRAGSWDRIPNLHRTTPGLQAGVQDFSTIVLATVLAALASVVPRMLSGPAEQPALAPATAPPADASAFFSE